MQPAIKSIILFLFSFLCLCHFLLQHSHRKVLWLNSSFSGLLGLPDNSVGKKSACNAEDPGSVPGLRRSAGEGKGYPVQYAGLENSMDCIVHGVTKELDTTEPLSVSVDCRSWLLSSFSFSSFLQHSHTDLRNSRHSCFHSISQYSEILVIPVSAVYPNVLSFIFLHLHCCHPYLNHFLLPV